MAARKAEGFNVTDACDAAEVSRSAFYAWQSRGEGPTVAEWDEALLINQIRDLHAGSDGTYGEPRMTVELGEGSRPAAGVTVTPGAVPVGDVRRRVSIRFTRVWRRGWGWAGVSGGVGEDASPVAV